MDQITIKGIPAETLLEFYEKYHQKNEKDLARKKKYREAHKAELNKQAKEYYQKRKEESGAATTPQGTSPK